MSHAIAAVGADCPMAGEEAGERLGAPLGDATTGHLLFTHGIVSGLAIHGDDALEGLFDARFAGLVPEVEVDGGSVTIEYPRLPRGIALHRELPAAMVLNTSIPWHLEIRGGMARMVADLRQIQICEVDLAGGVADARLLLPHQFGTTPIRVSGGIGGLSILRPEGVGVRLDITGGGADLTLDEGFYGPVGGEGRWESAEYRTATDRYDIRITGGVSRLVVARW